MNAIDSAAFNRAEDGAMRILTYITNESGSPEGTPKRMVNALKEMTQGYDIIPEDIARKARYEATRDELIVVANIPFASLCEHHVLPFIGVAHVGYLPDRYLVGLSKIPRIVQAFAQRLQMQERLTIEIAETLQSVLHPKGTGVVIEASHHCTCYRGVRAVGTKMITNCLLKALRDETREEFFSTIDRHR